MLRGLIWLAVLVGCSVLGGWAGPGLRGAGGPVLLAVIGLAVLTGFWWFTIWFLLAGRISWRDLFPAAVATTVFWVAMEAVFSVIFSGMVISDDKKYGPIGVVFALMSYVRLLELHRAFARRSQRDRKRRSVRLQPTAPKGLFQYISAGYARREPRQHSQSVLGMLIEPCRGVATQSSRRIVI